MGNLYGTDFSGLTIEPTKIASARGNCAVSKRLTTPRREFVNTFPFSPYPDFGSCPQSNASGPADGPGMEHWGAVPADMTRIPNFVPEVSCHGILVPCTIGNSCVCVQTTWADGSYRSRNYLQSSSSVLAGRLEAYICHVFVYFNPSASRAKGQYKVIPARKEGNCAFEAALRSKGEAAELTDVLALRLRVADHLRQNRAQYDIYTRADNSESGATDEEIINRTPADVEEIKKVGAGKLLYREYCDRVGKSGDFVGEGALCAIGMVLDRRLVYWYRCDGGIKRSSWHAYGPENALELPLVFHEKNSHYDGLCFSEGAQTLQHATLSSPDQVCVPLNFWEDTMDYSFSTMIVTGHDDRIILSARVGNENIEQKIRVQSSMYQGLLLRVCGQVYGNTKGYSYVYWAK